MFILFSPSESKDILSPFNKIDDKSFLFSQLYQERETALRLYQDFLNSASNEELKKLFGLKKDCDINHYKIDIFNASTQKAVLRYNGVGYKYLDYKTLPKESKSFIDNHMIIFSNLFGPILAKDKIPLYKLKQGEKIKDFVFEKFYKENFTDALNELLQDYLIIDLRASFYDKFYTPNNPYITIQFLRNGKSVSHWAKAYRGKLARELAIYKPKNEDDFFQIEFKNLKIKEILELGLKKKIVFEIENM